MQKAQAGTLRRVPWSSADRLAKADRQPSFLSSLIISPFHAVVCLIVLFFSPFPGPPLKGGTVTFPRHSQP